MTSDAIAQLIYLLVLGGAVVVWFFANNRMNLGKSLKMAVTWVFLFAGTAGVIWVWETVMVPDSKQSLLSGESVELARWADGHYYATLGAEGQDILFLVDTGASGVVLSTQAAEQMGYDLEELQFQGYASTANGEVRTARVVLEDLSLGPHIVENFPVYVTQGELDTSLLGMDFLSKFDRIEIYDDRMILHP